MEIYRAIVNDDGVVLVTTGGKMLFGHAINRAVQIARESGEKQIKIGKAAVVRSGLVSLGFPSESAVLGLGGAEALAQRL